MHLQDINKLLNLQDVTITTISKPIDKIVFIKCLPTSHTQSCDCCKSVNVIRKGCVGYRQVRHLRLFQYETILQLPRIRMMCKDCGVSFSWSYSFVQGKSRSTEVLKGKVASDTIGSTVKHTSITTNIPYSNCERMFKGHLDHLVPVLDQKAKDISKNTNKLVLGIDDFAIRKGHRYNTGIHDIRNGSLLHIIEGRTLNDLRNDYEKHPDLYSLRPIAVVMDLAKYYHTFAKEVFPDAIRIADRFHVNRYILDALQNIRRRTSKEQTPQNYKFLKQNKSLLSKRSDTLKEDEIPILEQMLNLNNELRDVYEMKEKLITWYECSSNIEQARYIFQKWLLQGKNLNIPELNQALITFQNWEEEITNYHYHRFTNAAVEGRNNKIKALQRRCYFTRNRKYYLYRIKAECNIHLLDSWIG